MPIRLRITVWTAGILLVSLLTMSIGVYYTMSHNLRAEMDTRLKNVFLSYAADPGSIQRDPDGRIVLNTKPDPFVSSGQFLQIDNPDGKPQYESESLGASTLPVPPDIVQQNAQFDARYYTTDVNGQPVRVFSAPFIIRTPAPQVFFLVQVGERIAPLHSTLAKLRTVMFIGSAVATLALAAVAWFVAGASLSPLQRVSTAAAAVGQSGDLSTRIEPPATRDEVQTLAEQFNAMLTRLEANFGAQRRFVADASHELRTPLTALRANADIMLRQIDAGMAERADLTEGLSDMRSEIDRMTRLVHNLLILARADVGWRPELATVDLCAVARDVARIAAPLRRGQTFTLDVGVPDETGADPELPVKGNADQLTQLMLILLDNAFTHTPAGAHVTLGAYRDGADAVVVVSDDGPGISKGHLQSVFERFYRADEARTRTSGGTGLGLSIARWIAAVHGGEIGVASEPDAGAAFTVRLPAVEPERAPASREQKVVVTAAS